ncbi:MAG: YlxR family protein [Bacilli bacterium]|nr:YlxR family protein [Bacilli bacterium]
MKTRKIPMRTCVVTLEKLPKAELIRIVKNKEGEVFADPTSRANGRGVYIKKDLEVLKQARKSKVLEKKLESTIEERVYEEIEEIVKS